MLIFQYVGMLGECVFLSRCKFTPNSLIISAHNVHVCVTIMNGTLDVGHGALSISSHVIEFLSLSASHGNIYQNYLRSRDGRMKQSSCRGNIHSSAGYYDNQTTAGIGRIDKIINNS